MKKLSELKMKIDETDPTVLFRYLKMLDLKIKGMWELLKFHREESYDFYIQSQKLRIEKDPTEERQWIIYSGLHACRDANKNLQREIYDKGIIKSYVEKRLGIPF